MDKIHPAVTVSNIKNFIPIQLEMENNQYSSWAELFKIHCRAFEVTDHLTGQSKTSTSSEQEKEKSSSNVSWELIDAIVLQWIYSTISNDLLHTILQPDSTAAQAWTALANIFQDNRNSRAVYLEHKFSNTRLDDFPSISAYCQALKTLSDQLANVGAPVTNHRLVLQLIAGLNEQYDGVAMLLQQTSPLPEFYEARSKLILEETRKANQATSAAAAAGTALHTTATKTVPDNPSYGQHFQPTTQLNQRPNDYRFSGRDSRNITRGRGRGQNRFYGRGRGSVNPSPTRNPYPIMNNYQQYQQWPMNNY